MTNSNNPNKITLMKVGNNTLVVSQGLPPIFPLISPKTKDPSSDSVEKIEEEIDESKINEAFNEWVQTFSQSKQD